MYLKIESYYFVRLETSFQLKKVKIPLPLQVVYADGDGGEPPEINLTAAAGGEKPVSLLI